ncbi:MAG: hypothetical protein IPI59_14835 [Sphingobacteriales bacterium]|jgi:hypothetical protein|nr:hypothetical protein [Sphingobacteriales bacterium]MBP9141632.1 hypothetical protein [Chitinophagales bacterium]MDA0198550.1 hypothetical protein [Bacteroidota bacterium]MBK7528781.1 hypothetical protein [Sphingobacteriales bacterium]MBK8679245.1 hypothetical protein [Sphingobacteriales bacterium]
MISPFCDFFGQPITVKTPQHFSSTQTSDVILAVSMMVIALVISYVVANAIAFEGSVNARDAHRRRFWFWAIGIFFTLGYFLYNYAWLSCSISPAFEGEFVTTFVASTLLLFGGYVLAGFLLSRFVFKNRKYGTLFPGNNN